MDRVSKQYIQNRIFKIKSIYITRTLETMTNKYLDNKISRNVNIIQCQSVKAIHIQVDSINDE